MSKNNQILMDQLRSMLEKITDFRNEVKTTDVSKIIQQDRLQLAISETNPHRIASNNRRQPEIQSDSELNHSSSSDSAEIPKSKTNKKEPHKERKYSSSNQNNSIDLEDENSSLVNLSSSSKDSRPTKSSKPRKPTNEAASYSSKNSKTKPQPKVKSIYSSDDSENEREKLRIQASFYAKGIDVDIESSDSEVDSVIAHRRRENLKKANDSSSAQQSESSNRKFIKRSRVKSPVQTQNTQTDDSVLSSGSPKSKSKIRKLPKQEKEPETQDTINDAKEKKKKEIQKALQLAKRYDNRKLRRSQGLESSKRGTDISDLSGFDSNSSSIKSSTPRKEKRQSSPSPSVSSLSSTNPKLIKHNQSNLEDSIQQNSPVKSPKQSPRPYDKYRVKSFLDSDNSDDINPIAVLTKTLDALHSSSDSDESIVFIKPKPDTIPFPRVTDDGIIEEDETESEVENKDEFHSSEDKNQSDKHSTDDDIEFKHNESDNDDENHSDVNISNLDINSDLDLDNDEHHSNIDDLLNVDPDEHKDDDLFNDDLDENKDDDLLNDDLGEHKDDDLLNDDLDENKDDDLDENKDDDVLNDLELDAKQPIDLDNLINIEEEEEDNTPNIDDINADQNEQGVNENEDNQDDLQGLLNDDIDLDNLTDDNEGNEQPDNQIDIEADLNDDQDEIPENPPDTNEE